MAAVHVAAFPNSALTMLGTEVVRRYYEWQLTGPHDIAALGAFVGAEVEGYCFGGVFRGAMSGFLHKNRNFLVWRVLTHPWFVTNPIFRGHLVTGVQLLRRLTKQGSKPQPSLPRPKQVVSSFTILAIATHPRCQGRGVGKLLMKRSEEIARQRGFQNMGLSVHTDNHQAINFYESLDWKKLSEGGKWSGEMRKSLDS